MPEHYLSPEHGYHPPAYSEEEIQTLRITRVHFLGEHLLFLLSDERALCVPLAISPALEAATHEQRYSWQLVGEGRGVTWSIGSLKEHLSLRTLLAHPDARVGALPATR